jgi:hypothetical protein
MFFFKLIDEPGKKTIIAIITALFILDSRGKLTYWEYWRGP